jgi:PleD family two-component response regulator
MTWALVSLLFREILHSPEELRFTCAHLENHLRWQALMKILVVEDDPRISDVLEYALKTDGHEVQTAQRGREAAETARGEM